MSEQRKRRNRILCLHGPTQSAASFRAALKPICDSMGRHFEYHFLEAPYIIPDVGDSEEQIDVWTRVAVDMGRVAALEADMAYNQHASNSKDIDSIKSRLQTSEEGKEIMAKAQYEDIESLVSRKTGRSLSRDWVTTAGEDRASVTGVHLSLLQIGDYMRENGTFHGVIGYDTGARLAVLLQSLLSYPLSASKLFPSFYPQLPKGVKRLPRMGGWEEEPPPPNDPRLGAENLTKEYVPTQKPFELLISLSSKVAATSTLGQTAQDWLDKRPPILSTTSPEAFPVHSVSITAEGIASLPFTLEKRFVCKSGEDILAPAWTEYLADWVTLAIASCQGDKEAARKLANSSPPSVAAKL